MKITEFMDVSILQQIQDEFSDATGLAAIATDAEGNYITEGSNFTEFCMKYTRGSAEGNKRCVKCDNECRGTYFCHAGLMDFGSDIVVDGQKVGGIVGGQVLPGAPDPEKFAAIARELGIDETKYIEAVNKVPIRTEKEIRAAADLLRDVVNKVVEQEYYRYKDKMLIDSLTEEIKNSIKSISVINDKVHQLQGIATKQNILTLNASIEAARSGEAGAGFAIVANEMGKLSKNSSELYADIGSNTQSINRFIEKMQEFLSKSNA